MGLISKLPEVLTQAKIEYENLKSAPFVVGEEVGQSGNILAEGDKHSKKRIAREISFYRSKWNKHFLKSLIK